MTGGPSAIPQFVLRLYLCLVSMLHHNSLLCSRVFDLCCACARQVAGVCAGLPACSTSLNACKFTSPACSYGAFSLDLHFLLSATVLTHNDMKSWSLTAGPSLTAGADATAQLRAAGFVATYCACTGRIVQGDHCMWSLWNTELVVALLLKPTQWHCRSGRGNLPGQHSGLDLLCQWCTCACTSANTKCTQAGFRAKWCFSDVLIIECCVLLLGRSTGVVLHSSSTIRWWARQNLPASCRGVFACSVLLAHSNSPNILICFKQYCLFGLHYYILRKFVSALQWLRCHSLACPATGEELCQDSGLCRTNVDESPTSSNCLFLWDLTCMCQ